MSSSARNGQSTKTLLPVPDIGSDTRLTRTAPQPPRQSSPGPTPQALLDPPPPPRRASSATATAGPHCHADPGRHVVAGVVSDEFLAFTAAQGNDLRVVPGMRAGCRWCLCTHRWLDAVRAFEAGRLPRAGVPRVDLEATEETALEGVDLERLRSFAIVEGQQSPLVIGVTNGVTNGVNGGRNQYGCLGRRAALDWAGGHTGGIDDPVPIHGTCLQWSTAPRARHPVTMSGIWLFLGCNANIIGDHWGGLQVLKEPCTR